ncbi:MAG: hypothetical protein ACXVPE_07230 [Bacteroidia bacterium]
MNRLHYFFAAVLFSLALSAQVQNGINYQAAARDNAGNILANQAVSFRLSILQGSPSGSTVYQETQSATTNTVGLVNFIIGTGTVNAGNYGSINWSAGPYFLQVEMSVTPAPYQLMGVSQFVSVPYALYSEHSGDKAKPGKGITISNDSINSTWTSYGNDAVANNSGNVGIGVTPNFQKLEVNGGVAIGNTATSSPGAMRFTGNDFEGYTGAGWKSFTKSSIDYFQVDNTLTGNVVFSSARNTMVLSQDSLIVPATGNYLILYTGKGYNGNSFDLATGAYDSEGRTGVINVTNNLNWVGGAFALFFHRLCDQWQRDCIPSIFGANI